MSQAPTLHVDFTQVAAFGRAMRMAAPEFLLRETGRALALIGKSDIAKMKSSLRSRLNIRFRGFENSFKWKATDSTKSGSIDDLQLSEYTGAKPFRIFQTGGEIAPVRSRTLTVLAPGGRTGGGKRKFTRKELRDMIAAGQLQIIQTKHGPAVVKPDLRPTKKGGMRRGSKVTIIAWLRPRAVEKQRIDFFGNFEANNSEHERILGEAADRAIEKTIADEGEF